MEIPKNIKKKHLLEAIKEIDDKGAPSDAQSLYYDLIYNGKEYPPKLVVSLANKFANGIELNRPAFRGGEGTECFKLLRTHGFVIEPKQFFFFLDKFLKQANDPVVNLKVDNYPKSFRNIAVKVSFGQGARANIPWIAFLREGQSVSSGSLYPVYLYYKDKDLLLLAYGVSETDSPRYDWPVDSESIEEYFVKNFKEQPKRYGTSHVYKAYNVTSDGKRVNVSESEANNDLNQLIDFYKSIDLGDKQEEKTIDMSQKPFTWTSFSQATKEANLIFSNATIKRFIASLQAKRFLILTGLAGSGKTKLATSFAKWIVNEPNQYCIVPVGADWGNREPLLGFPNALNSEEYVKPDNCALQLIIEAEKHPEKPYFLILDEMNLSHVERYFADFLSVMESGDKITLHSGNTAISGIPPSVTLSPNLYLIGTVNVDETTYMFSPKVLDRANVIEFQVSEAELANFLDQKVIERPIAIDFLGSDMAQSFLTQTARAIETDLYKEKVNTFLTRFFNELKPIGAEFGYRTIMEVYRLVDRVLGMEEDYGEKAIDIAIDIAIVQKLLPKLHGSKRKLSGPLAVLAKLCLHERAETKDVTIETKDIEADYIRFPVSFEKLRRMYQHAERDGFTSFAEA
ncbi:McrB family protein [Parapedobacter sp. 2B3]|uniref:McrB family protein n=1 Tax=Parapedobacter sp. 2B3 TaxID=3342381 RepID=UPI0035B613BC